MVAGPVGGGSPRSSVHLVSGVPARPAPVRCSWCLLRSLVGTPVPSCVPGSSWSALKRPIPTQSVVQGFIDITPSSSSSQVWKLGIEPLPTAQVPNGPVGRLWVVSVPPVSTRGHLDGCAPRPAVVHLLSPVSPCCIPRPRRVRAKSRLLAPRGRTRRMGPSDSRDGRGAVYLQVTTMSRGSAPMSGGRPCRSGDGRSVTRGEPAATRSPQPVHIPGDNFSTSRPWSPTACRQLPPSTRASPVSTSVHGCGQPPGQSYCLARLLMRAVSSVTCV